MYDGDEDGCFFQLPGMAWLDRAFYSSREMWYGLESCLGILARFGMDWNSWFWTVLDCEGLAIVRRGR